MNSEAISEVGWRSSSPSACKVARVSSNSSMFRSDRVRYSPTGMRKRSIVGVAAHQPGHVLGAVLAGLGGEVPEPAEELDAHATLKLGVAVDHLAQPRVQVLAVPLEPQDERLMVEAGGLERDLVLRHADQLREEVVGVAHGVAETDDTRERVFAAETAHGSIAIGLL